MDIMRKTAIFLSAVLILLSASCNSSRRILEVEDITVTTPEGSVPRLPYRIQVKYAGGFSEFRQLVWENSDARTEKEEAVLPAGSTYEVQGYIIGDNTTEKGFPVKAKVEVTADAWEVPAAAPLARPLPLSDVLLTGDNRLTSNRDLDTDNLLSLDIRQQLYNYRDTYGLGTEGYPVSDGWDSPRTKLKGHGSGHYMSAIAFAYAGCTDPAKKEQLKDRARTMVDALRECQERTFVWEPSLGRYREARDLAPEAELKNLKGDWESFETYKKDWKKYGYGYLNAIPAQHPVLIEMYRPYNNDQWVWAPYYSIHKQLAGLVDIADNIDDPAISGKALLIARDMGLWVWNRLHYRTYVQTGGETADRRAKPGNRYEMWNMYIAGEVGGMEEVLSRLSEKESDPELKARLLEAASFFVSPAFFDPLSRNVDDIRTRHANQHIPMITGALRSYRSNADPYFYNVAYNFWNMIQGRYVYSMGGVGNGEMFRQPYSQMGSMLTNNGPDLNETCCAYNMAKLTKELNCYDPDNAAYMDYYEKVLYNQLVGSVHPEEYSTTYQYAVGMNASKPFDNDTPQSSCCGGTGSENHVKYQEAAYFVSDDTIWTGLYLPSVANWREKGIVLEQECLWPAERSTIRIKEGSGEFTMKLRVPWWATAGFSLKINGKKSSVECKPGSYAVIQRNWKEGDEISVEMPFPAHLDFGPDKMSLASVERGEPEVEFEPAWVGTIMYGPLVMATPDVGNWFDADLRLSSGLKEIKLHGASSDTGYAGNIYTLSVGGRNFLPDYHWHTGHATHYLRLFVGKEKGKSSAAIDRSQLEKALSLASERMEAQKAWEELETKVPEFAPWAPNGYAKLVEKTEAALEVGSMKDKNLTQARVTAAANSLGMALNSMRPGNLAEPEDLRPLQRALMEIRRSGKEMTPALKEAVDYAQMVVKYVGDGSGTPDMIQEALSRLQ